MENKTWAYDSGPLEVESVQEWNAAIDSSLEYANENYGQIENNLREPETTESNLIKGTGLPLLEDTLYFEPTNEMLAQFTGDHLFILYDGGQDMVTVNLDTGDIKFGDNYTPNKAAQLFWDTIGSFKVDQDQQTAELEYANIDWIEPTDKTEKQLELLEDSIVVYKEHRPAEEETYVSQSAIDMVKKAIVNHKFDDAMKVID